MIIKYSSIFHSKALLKFTQIGILGLKTNHLATLNDITNGDGDYRYDMSEMFPV
jgi:hypothetical protein